MIMITIMIVMMTIIMIMIMIIKKTYKISQCSRYGYDTGVGYNRQFKYEERDNYGVLHGR